MHDRRSFLKASAALAVLGAAGCARSDPEDEGPRWDDAAFRRPDRSRVAVLAADAYDHRLVDVVRRGVDLCGLDVRDRRVVLKPNFVEFDPGAVINTNPVLIASVIEAFRTLGAASVTVAEGPGHRRDTDYILDRSGLRDTLADLGARYVDLNVDAFAAVPTVSRFTDLGRLLLPATVTGADLLVSMPKLKVHHWAGVTLSMKNLFGIMPGAAYGWPKNVLHHAGIDGSIIDINAALPVPRFNIVDGIVGMEGDGPIDGDAHHTGVLVFGHDPVAVDATGARLMGIEPARVDYLRDAGRFLGNLEYDRIALVGEPLEPFAADYRLPHHLQALRPVITDGA